MLRLCLKGAGICSRNLQFAEAETTGSSEEIAFISRNTSAQRTVWHVVDKNRNNRCSSLILSFDDIINL